MSYRSLLLSYFNIDTISYQGVLLSTVIVEPSRGYSHTFYHTEWLDGIKTSQFQWKPGAIVKFPPVLVLIRHLTKHWYPPSPVLLHVFSCALYHYLWYITWNIPVCAILTPEHYIEHTVCAIITPEHYIEHTVCAPLVYTSNTMCLCQL